MTIRVTRTTTNNLSPAWLKADIRLQAAASNGAPRRFAIEAYDGGPLPVDGFDYPVIVDLESLEFPESMPLLIDHEGSVEATLGCTDAIENTGQNIHISGLVTATSLKAMNVVTQADKGQRWQASIGVRPSVHAEHLQRVHAGQRVAINGQEFEGPLLILKHGQMYETSVLPAGADQTTRVNLAAKAARLLKGSSMLTFEEFLADMGFESVTLTDDQRAGLTLMYDAQNNPPPAVATSTMPTEPAPAVTTPTSTTPVEPAPTATAPTVTAAGPDAATIEKAREQVTQEMLASIRKTQTEELQRISDINAIASRYPKILQAAIGGGWDAVKTENAVLNEDVRIQAPISRGGITTSMETTPQVLEAAICQSRKLPGFEKHFEDKTLQAAHTTFGRAGIGLQQLLLMAAAANGYSASAGERVSNGNLRNVLRAAFPGDGVQAAFSTTSLPGILSNVANKELLAGYEADEQLMLWKRIADIKSVSDFKTANFSALRSEPKKTNEKQGREHVSNVSIGGVSSGAITTESFTRVSAPQFTNERSTMQNDKLARIHANARRCKKIEQRMAREVHAEAGKALYVDRVLGITRPADVQYN